MKKIQAALTRQFSNFFLAPSTGETLSLLRIVVGIAMFYQAFLLFPDRHELYGLYGLMQADMIEKISGPALPGFLATRLPGPSGTNQVVYRTRVAQACPRPARRGKVASNTLIRH